MEIRNILTVLLVLVGLAVADTCTAGNAAVQFDWNAGTAVQGKKMSELVCVKDTQIDFYFPQASTGNLAVTNISGAATYSQYRFTNNGGSTLQFLNRDGVNQSFTLDKITLVKYSTGASTPIANAPLTPDYELSVTYANGKNETVSVSFDLILSTVTIPSSVRNVIKSSATSAYPGLQTFYKLIKNVQSASTTLDGITALSLFNQIEFSHFFTQMNTASNCKTSFLLNRLMFQLPAEADPTAGSYTASPFAVSPTNKQATTGNLLCYGSIVQSAVFQTHLRDSFPLWAAWFSVLIFWISLLFGEATTVNLYDEKYENNKWTNWGMYSLFNLAHEEYFTRMMRTVPMYTVYSWQGCVAAILYCHLGPTMPDPSTIIIFAVISWAVSLPLQWIFGAFTKHYYNVTLQKLIDKKKLKNLKDKESDEANIIEIRIEGYDRSCYTAYYWMYIFALVCFIAFWTIAVNRLQLLPREFYYQQSYWIAALMIAWVLDNFVFDPLFTWMLGGTAFYRFRPYYYDARLGQTFKELQS